MGLRDDVQVHLVPKSLDIAGCLAVKTMQTFLIIHSDNSVDF
jgi:hypothetical protein